jgi:hypothetical protein
MSSFNRFKDYLEKIKEDDEQRCWFCNKSAADIIAEYEEYMQNPDVKFDNVDKEDLIIMTFKTKKPICAGCYFAIRENQELIDEIFERPEDEIWGEP